MIELRFGDGRVVFGTRAIDVREQPDGFGPVFAGHQVHGATVLRDASGEADGFVSTDPLTGALVRTADCLPVALLGPGGAAMLHGGWRGLAAGIIPAGLAALGEVTIAVLGPSARSCCYEVGEEVHAQFAGYDARRGDNLALDAVATQQLAGIEVVDTGICTMCDERFFSHRREGDAAGRQGNVAWPS